VADLYVFRLHATNAAGQFGIRTLSLTAVPGPPRILVNDGNFGIRSNRFGFNLVGPPGQAALIQASTDLKHWVTLRNCQFANTPLGFVDPESPLCPKPFYRLMDAAGAAMMEQQRWQRGQFHLNLVGKPGCTVVVEASTNLTHWTPIATNVLGSDPIPSPTRQAPSSASGSTAC